MNFPQFRRLLPVAVLAAFSGPAFAISIDTNWIVSGGLVPDGDPAGWSDTRFITGFSGTSITDINVSLSVSGGWNGDLYAYLQHSTGISILLNRPGRTAANPFGYSDGGFNVSFDDTGANGDSHLNFTGAAILGGGSWQPDGRAYDPAAVLDSTARTGMLSSFHGFDPDGSWTLFVADMSGGGQSTVNGWGLHIETQDQSPVRVSDTGGTLWLLAGGVWCCLAGRRWAAK